ncbi:Gfo/Idh/MocA family oxidoreductase [Lacipirellula sp.]|uniref:Gfo/Idh/MocA family oxidoreductase n=1 Tax=Lacipirellula sp. TaxID=2691419 RepID=UPI003D0F01A7
MNLHRRHFLKCSLATAAAVTLRQPARAASTDGIRVAQIGFRAQGATHLSALGDHIVALCDVDEHVLNSKAAEYNDASGKKIPTYVDYRKLLERNDIDAVSIATPNHTHALITIAALQAGKHVYCEKPASHNIWEGRQMVAAARKHGKMVQIGTQSRSSPALKEAITWLHDGGLGRVQYAVGTCYKRRPDIGKSDKPLVFPSHIHRDLWIGPAADQAIYRPAINSQGVENPHYDWHWDFNTGGGDLANQGIHQMDVARWCLGESALAPRVLSIGGRLGYDDAGTTANTQLIYHEYPAAPLLFEVHGLPKNKNTNAMDSYRGSSVGVVVQCEKGHLLIPNYTEAHAFDRDGTEIKSWRGEPAHHDNWLRAIEANDASLLNAPVYDGHISSGLCHAGNVSYRLGKRASTQEIDERVKDTNLLAEGFRRLCDNVRRNEVDIDDVSQPALTLGEWLDVDPNTDQFVANDRAAELWQRKCRAPFIVPDIESQLKETTAAKR